MGWENTVPFAELVGKTLVSAEKTSDEEIVLTADNGDRYEMYHDQECCESVSIEDICGELEWLVGAPILHAEESTNSDDPKNEEGWIDDPKNEEGWIDESRTWTFYHLRTMRGTVTIRWYGTSNGYYSESVDLHLVKANEDGTRH